MVFKNVSSGALSVWQYLWAIVAVPIIVLAVISVRGNAGLAIWAGISTAACVAIAIASRVELARRRRKR
jgi:hypothetical protein